ncbi:hypothetical protein GFC29_1415 [Anoxybacillus sp. B7M1]|jgi:hypothetical protein|uniref:Uncharacterized protein n=1 Tax=Anoxybacteroides rupiense TaxID=311460 RepID=A0ABD5IVB8_9BACL|nr:MULTISPECIES: hypothetical protein [Anoxybacillus]ANB58910.1 hypothetical protein GFC28_209 [Anoxybacillus sp. B2M1]ANB65783.1 hypothetical protein GFC29_1415 [Anoxybacillus sp. B7M1]KXG10978.1 hypothetical protein AT864_00061 [Anoxybacillus sp. P3H1B]MBB3906555.1 hypothetical protein [Anoxybacillus rupiensis]MBS2770319.1 hypothetical protein [Anoxybacillus rupiensis]
MAAFMHLFEAYRSLWSNRSLNKEEELTEERCKALIHEAIEKELRDEMTHPRVRQAPEVKFHYAVKRIMASPLANETKLALIELHLDVMEYVQR